MNKLLFLFAISASFALPPLIYIQMHSKHLMQEKTDGISKATKPKKGMNLYS